MEAIVITSEYEERRPRQTLFTGLALANAPSCGLPRPQSIRPLALGSFNQFLSFYHFIIRWLGLRLSEANLLTWFLPSALLVQMQATVVDKQHGKVTSF